MIDRRAVVRDALVAVVAGFVAGFLAGDAAGFLAGDSTGLATGVLARPVLGVLAGGCFADVRGFAAVVWGAGVVGVLRAAADFFVAGAFAALPLLAAFTGLAGFVVLGSFVAALVVVVPAGFAGAPAFGLALDPVAARDAVDAADDVRFVARAGCMHPSVVGVVTRSCIGHVARSCGLRCVRRAESRARTGPAQWRWSAAY